MELVPFRRRNRGGIPTLWNQMDSLFDSFFENSLRDSFDHVFGDTKYVDSDGNAVIEIEVPGFNQENLNVEIADGILTLSGKREYGDDQSHAGQSQIARRMTVGNVEDVKAEIKDGILKLVLMYPRKEVKSVKIESE